MRLDSIMERHPGANRVLMMIGTNDSGVTNPAPILPGPFGVQVSTIANAIVTDGKQVWLAEILPIIGDAARNTTIQLYNTQIRGIANLAVDDKFLGPDFYDGPVYGFNGKPGLYADTLHPNDAGYQVMANGWDASLP